MNDTANTTTTSMFSVQMGNLQGILAVYSLILIWSLLFILCWLYAYWCSQKTTQETHSPLMVRKKSQKRVTFDEPLTSGSVAVV